MLTLPNVNLLAILVAAAGAFASGGIYWAIFTPMWIKALGKQAPTSRPGPASFVAVFVSRIFVAFVISVFAGYAHAESAIPGIEIGFLGWLGFIFPLGIGQLAFGQGSWKSFLIGTIEALIGLLIIGAIIGVWQ